MGGVLDFPNPGGGRWNEVGEGPPGRTIIENNRRRGACGSGHRASSDKDRAWLWGQLLEGGVWQPTQPEVTEPQYEGYGF